MKKIMFNDRYGLTDAVLSGRKTMTRRIIKGDFEDIKAYHANGGWHFIADTSDGDSVEVKPAYDFGEEVAVAQSYQTLIEQGYLADDRKDGWVNEKYITSAGYGNKMFVRADIMPHRIIITNLKFERLQDISDEDIMREGIMEGEFMYTWDRYYYDSWGDVPNYITFPTARAAFASLIDRISGRGTWERNPWVFAYEFKLID